MQSSSKPYCLKVAGRVGKCQISVRLLWSALGSSAEIVENTLGQGQGANSLLASMCWDGLSNPTI